MDEVTARVLKGAIVGGGDPSADDSHSTGATDRATYVQEFDPRTKPTISILLYANPGEFDQELAALHHKTVPALRSHAHELGLDLEVLDLSFCAGAGDVADPRTFETAHATLEACRGQSNGPYFVGLLGQRPGPRVIPLTLSKNHYDLLGKEGTDDQKLLLRSWYRLDENADPPRYVLQPLQEKLPALFSVGSGKGEANARTSALSQWHKAAATIADLISSVHEKRNGATRDVPEPAPTALHQMLHAAVLGPGAVPTGCVVAGRSFKDADRHLQDDALARFVEVKDGAIDSDTAQELSMLTTQLKGAMDEEDLVTRTITWAEKRGVEPKNMDHRNYLRSLQSGVQERIKAKAENASRTVAPTDPLLEEVVTHSRFTATLLQQPDLYSHVVEAEKSYMSTTGLVKVVAPAGSERPALAARIVHHIKSSDPSRLVCARYCGISPASSSVHGLLTSLCHQVGRVLGRNTDAMPRFTHQLPALLVSLLHEMSPSAALVIDRVDHITRGRPQQLLLYSLFSKLSEVALVAVVSDADLSWLPSNARSIEATPMPKRAAEEAVEQALKRHHRALTRTQRQAVSNGFNRCTAPLYVLIATELALSWHSYDSSKSATLAPTMSQLLNQYLQHIEEECGQVMTAACFSYVALSRFGLHRQELLDLLSLDNEALKTCEVGAMPAGIMRFPYARLARWLRAAAPLLAHVAVDAGTAICIVSPEIEAAVCTRYLRPAAVVAASKVLRDYWTAHWASDPRPFPGGSPSNRLLPQQPLVFEGPLQRPNLRVLHELPHAIVQCRDVESLDTHVCFNFHFLQQYVKCASVEEAVALFDVQTSQTGDKSHISGTGAALNGGHGADDRDETARQNTARRLVASALQLSEHVLCTDPEQLPVQLTGRLRALARDHADIQVLLEDASKHAQESRHDRCVPTVTCMAEPTTAPKLIMAAYEEVNGIAYASHNTVIASDGVQVVSEDGFITDVETPEKDMLALFSSPTRLGVLYANKCIIADVKDGSVVSTIPCGGHMGRFFSSSQKEQVLIVDDGAVSCFDTHGKKLCSFPLHVHAVSACADKQHVLVATEEAVLRWHMGGAGDHPPMQAALPQGAGMLCLSPHRIFMLKENERGMQAVLVDISRPQEHGKHGEASEEELVLKETSLPLRLPKEDYTIALSPHGTTAVLACHNMAIVLRLPGSDEEEHAFAVQRVETAPILPSEIEMVAVDDEGNFALCTDDGHVLQYDGRRETKKHTPPAALPNAIEAIALSDKLHDAIGCSPSGYRHWDLHNGSMSATTIESFSVSPEAVAACCVAELPNGHVACVDGCGWKRVDPTSLSVEASSQGDVDSAVVAVVPHRGKVLSLHADRVVRLWSLHGELVQTSDDPVPDSLWPIKSIKSGSALALLASTGACCTIDGSTLACQDPLPYSSVSALAVCDAGVVVGVDRDVILATSPPVALGEHTKPVKHVECNGNAVISSAGEEAIAWDLRTRQRTHTLLMDQPITAVAITAVAQPVVVTNNILEVWDATEEHRITRFVADHPIGVVAARDTAAHEHALFLALGGAQVAPLPLPRLAKERAKMRGVSMLGPAALDPSQILKQRSVLKDVRTTPAPVKPKAVSKPREKTLDELEGPTWVVRPHSQEHDDDHGEDEAAGVNEDHVVTPSDVRRGRRSSSGSTTHSEDEGDCADGPAQAEADGTPVEGNGTAANGKKGDKKKRRREKKREKKERREREKNATHGEDDAGKKGHCMLL